MDKIFYNESSSAKLGWTPDWFGATHFDEDLLKKVKEFQKEYRLTADGLVGPSTYRRIWTVRESELLEHAPREFRNRKESFILCNNNYVDIEWPSVVLPIEAGGLRLTKGYKVVREKRDVSNFVCHWDVCLSSESCFRVLKNRGISVHFAIDNDGTIYQFMDCNHIAYHAGSSKWNSNSIGVEISNAYYPKHQAWYKSKGYGERPLMERKKVHGKYLDSFLGFYDVQLEALKALMAAIHRAYEIPLDCPLSPNNKTSTGICKAAVNGRFNGFISHYHLTNRKIDCAGLDLKRLLEEIK